MCNCACEDKIARRFTSVKTHSTSDAASCVSPPGPDSRHSRVTIVGETPPSQPARRQRSVRRRLLSCAAVISSATLMTDSNDDLLFAQRVRIAAELLESLDADRTQLTRVTEAERQRLLHATRRVAEPDHHARRKLVKAGRRARKAARLQQDDQVLSSAGIRELRRKPVFTTPNAYREPPPESDAPRATSESQHCYVCKQHYDTVHFFYDQLCPTCAELNFAQRTETAAL